MALPISGPLSMSMIRTELGLSVTDFNLRSAELGFYVFINQNSPLKPDGNSPYTISEWYGYDHTYNPNLVFGELFVGGAFSEFTGDGVPQLYKHLVSIKADGSFTSGFNGTNGIDSQVNDLLNYQGKLFVVGNFTTYKGVTRNRIVLVNAFNGNEETSFVVGTGFNNITRCLASTKSGTFGIFVGGNFTSYKGVTRNRIIKLLTNGSEDTSFVVGTGFNSITYCMATDSTNKLFVGGSFTTYKGVTRNRIIKLLTNGSEDTSFVVGTGFNGIVRVIKPLSDGTILIGGDFTSYKGVTRNRIAKLQANGTLITSFNPYFDGPVNAIAVDSNGSIYVGGSFGPYGSQSNSICKLTISGSADPEFNQFFINVGFFRYDTLTSTNVIGVINSIHINEESPTQIIVGGWFDSYNGQTATNIVAIGINGEYDEITPTLSASIPITDRITTGSVNVIVQNTPI